MNPMSFPAMMFTPICGASKIQIDPSWQWTSWATKRSKMSNRISLFPNFTPHPTVSSCTEQTKAHSRCAIWESQSSAITMPSISRMKPACNKRISSLKWSQHTQVGNFCEMESTLLLETSWLSKFGTFVMLRNLYRTLSFRKGWKASYAKCSKTRQYSINFHSLAQQTAAPSWPATITTVFTW